jgi:hypothetical protein
MAKDEHKEEARQLRAVIDRIEEGDVAVLMVGEDGKTQMEIPISLLPEGAKDGDHLRIHISLDRPSRSGAEERIKKLQDELKGRSGTADKKDFKL